MDDHAGGFIHHQKIFVLPKNIQGNGFGLQGGFGGRGQMKAKRLAHGRGGGRIGQGGATFKLQSPFGDQPHEAAARERPIFWQSGGQSFIKAGGALAGGQGGQLKGQGA